MTYPHIKALILDWAGTTVDFGSLAPVCALQSVFAANGVPVTPAEVREHMGVLKKDQIRAICAGERVKDAWTARHGRAPAEADVELMFGEFLPRQAAILADFSQPIPGVPETIEAWKSAGLRIGSTTGYTHDLMNVVMPVAARLGYAPDTCVTPDEVGAGRPKPFMCYRNAIMLGVYPLWCCVKIGDTPVDVAEGLNAGMWTIAITGTGNEIGVSLADWQALSAEERCRRESEARQRLVAAGAHFTASSLTACGELLEEIERRIAAGEKP